MHSLPEDLGGNLFSLFPEWRLIKGDPLPVEEEKLNADTWTDLELTLVYQMVMDVCWAGGHIDRNFKKKDVLETQVGLNFSIEMPMETMEGKNFP